MGTRDDEGEVLEAVADGAAAAELEDLEPGRGERRRCECPELGNTAGAPMRTARWSTSHAPPRPARTWLIWLVSQP